MGLDHFYSHEAILRLCGMQEIGVPQEMMRVETRYVYLMFTLRQLLRFLHLVQCQLGFYCRVHKTSRYERRRTDSFMGLKSTLLHNT
jgi:hypothetical protein